MLKPTKKTKSNASQNELDKSEELIQHECWRWYHNTYCLPIHSPLSMCFHIANENQHRLARTGVMSGVADLYINHKGRHFWVEMKTPTGKQSPKQIEFEEKAKKCGVDYYVIRSLDEFKQLINKIEYEHGSRFQLL